MTITDPIDAGRLGLLLNDLRLPAIKTMWADFASRADAEGWPAARFLAALAEHEVAERARRRFERRLDGLLLHGRVLDGRFVEFARRFRHHGQRHRDRLGHGRNG